MAKKSKAKKVPLRPRKPRRKPRRFPKVEPRETTVVDCVADAWGTIEELAGEMRDWASNMEEKLSHTEKYNSVNETADTLENVSEPDAPENETVAAIKVTVMDQQMRAKPYSRADRLGQAAYLLEQASDALDAFSGSEDPDLKDDDAAAADEYKQSIDELKEAVEGADFPGMYG